MAPFRSCQAAAVMLVGCCVLAPTIHAQPDRLAQAIDASHSVVLKGNRNLMARLEDDRGPVGGSERISGMSLVLKGSGAQQAALKQLLEEQRDPASPNYHKWLTPEEYADRFGLSRNDFRIVTSWLESQGFRIDYMARGRNWIGFSGTAGQIKDAFHTEIHRYIAGGETHYANASDPAIPAALAPVVSLIRGLDDFRLPPGVRPKPMFTANGLHAV